MASRIQGITVEVGGDTTKLITALKGVNGEIRNTQSQLRDVEKLLKLDPGNTELLSQKQRILNAEVQATKEKLEALKIASEQANAALEQGTISKDQYDALQREIIATESALEELEKQAEQSAVALQKISVMGTKLQDIGSKVEGVGKFLLPLSAAVTGVGVAGLKVATDFEKAMSGVQAITGATGDEFEKLRETAINLGATTAFSSGEVAEAMTEMAKAGWSTTQIIDGMAGVLDAAAASGESLGTVATIVADAITGFGLSAKDSARVADLMTQAANSGTIGVSDLGESYKYVAPLAQSMGLSIEDVTTALSAMSMAGIKGSQAGTSLRTVLANMTKPSSTVASAMDELNLSITNSDGSFKSLDEIITTMRTSFSGLTDDQKAYYATALAGKEGMSGLISLLNLTQEEYDALTASMNNCSGVAGETAAVMQDNLQSKVEQLGGALESLAIKLSEYVIPFLTGLVEKITAAVDAFTNMNPIVQKAVLVIGGILAVAGPILIVVGKIISAVGTIMTVVPKLAGVINTVKTAFAALNAAMLANPVFLVIAAITALVAAFIYLWNNCDEFRQFWIDLWENIKQAAIAVWTALKEFFTAAWQTISSTAQTIWNGLRNFFSALWEGIKTIFNSALNVIKTIVTTYFNVYKTIITTVFNAIKTVIANILNAIKTVITTVWNTIKNVFTTVLNAIKSVVSSAFSSMWNGIKNTVFGIVNTIKNGFNNAVSFIKGLASSAFSWGADMIMGIVNGIRSCIGKVKDAVSNVANTIRSFLHFSVPDEGPLTDYESWMPDFMSGLAKGIEQSKSMVTKAVEGVAGDMVISPQMAAMESRNVTPSERSVTSAGLSGITTAITEAFSQLNGQNGDIVIPIYLGGTMLDEVIVNAQQRMNLRSGGR